MNSRKFDGTASCCSVSQQYVILESVPGWETNKQRKRERKQSADQRSNANRGMCKQKVNDNIQSSVVDDDDSGETQSMCAYREGTEYLFDWNNDTGGR